LVRPLPFECTSRGCYAAHRSAPMAGPQMAGPQWVARVAWRPA
jgi:hypothetical protein